MKFIEAIKALGPGQLLINPTGARLEIRDGVLWLLGMPYPPDRVLYQDRDGWKVEDKPRHRVKFADAIAAAAKGATIKSELVSARYKMKSGCLADWETEHPIWLSPGEQSGDWEIIEAEDDK